MTIELPALPYAPDALAPYISAETISFHYNKHHQTYVTNTNNLLQDSPLAQKSLEEIIVEAKKDKDLSGLFNNAAQVWNHTFFWNSMKHQGGGDPSGELKNKIEGTFGNLDKFKEEFKKVAVSQFGSGWAWLALSPNGQLEIMKTANAELPMTSGYKSLITLDVWEHSYYLDYQNRRPDYIDEFLNHLINWDFAAQNFKNA